MTKVIFTEKDIEEMVKRGQMTLEVDEQANLTDLAYEKACRLGVRIVSSTPEKPPAAPVRPYLSQKLEQVKTKTGTDDGELALRIRKAVQARLGGQIDPNLLEAIIHRVLESTGAK